MLNIKKIILLLFIIFLSGKSNAQNYLKMQFEKANNLFQNEDYYDAITEYKRLMFFDSSKVYTYRADMMIGNCYKMGAKFSDAILYYTYSEIAANSLEEIFNARINAIRANILRRTTSRALTMLDKLAEDKRFVSKSKEINYWKGWAYIFSDEWKKAQDAFAQTDTNASLAALCKKVSKEKYSVTWASILSHFIPGSGQFYTGHIWSGLLSLGWNVLWGYVSVDAFNAGRIFDGLMISNLLWLRFYVGNLQNAKEYAVQKNLDISNSALNYLQFKYKGLKP